MKRVFTITLFLSIGFQIFATTLPSMKRDGVYCFFGDAQMRSIIDFCSTHKKYTFMSFDGNGAINFMYFIAGTQKASIDIEIFNSTYGKEIQLKVPLLWTCPGNYNSANTLKCLEDMSRFISIEQLAIDRLNTVFNKYIIKNQKYKNHNIQIIAEALHRGGMLKEFQKYKPKYDTGEIGFYFQLTKKWRLYVFIRKEKDNLTPIYYRLTTDSGKKKFIIDLTKE